jgi:hypothetical protein
MVDGQASRSNFAYSKGIRAIIEQDRYQLSTGGMLDGKHK